MASLKNTTINDTGYLTIPSGTIAQRPASPSAGMFRYNSDFKLNEFYNGTEWTTSTGENSIVRSGLVLWLDAGLQSSYPGSGTTWTDLSGLSNTGTLTNGPTYNSSNGGSIVFDGSDDYVNCGSNSSLSLNSMTISAWIRASTDSTNYRGIIMDESVGGSPWNYRLYLNISNGFVIYDINGGGSGAVTSNFGVNNNQWYYLCGTRSAVGGTMSLYINGVLNNTSTDGSTRTTLGNSVWIGRSPYLNGSYPFIGNISQVSIYNRALTAAEISQNYFALKNRFGL